MSASIKSLAMSVLLRHGAASIQSQPLTAGETAVRLTETASVAGTRGHVEASTGGAQSPHWWQPGGTQTTSSPQAEAVKPAETTFADLPPLGRRNARGEMVLTVEDLPEIERRLRLSGWKVTRRGNELICTSPRTLRIQ